MNLSPDQIAALDHHRRVLLAWNAKMNLTTVSSPQELEEFHYQESLFVGAHLPQGQLRIADVGSGAGFPGIPIAIIRPECQITLIESNRRKAVFLKEASRPLRNVTIIAERSEAIQATFDWVVSRAVRPEEVLALSLASQYALLISSADLATLPAPEAVLKLPRGNDRVLAMFHVEHDRIDNTSG